MFTLCCGDAKEGKKNGLMSRNPWDSDDDDMVQEKLSRESTNREKQIVRHNLAKKRQMVYATCSIDVEDNFEPPVHPKTKQEHAFIDEALGDNFIFSNLKDHERHMLVQAMQKEQVKAGTCIINEGETGDFFYVLEKGEVEFIAQNEKVGLAQPGSSFGELALLYHGPRAATCKAVTNCTLWKVDQQTFRAMLAQQSHNVGQDMTTILKKVEILSGLGPTCMNKVIDAMTPVTYAEGERIVNKGDIGEIFYIVQKGSVKCHDIGLGDSQFVDQILSEGDWFGERALLTGEPRAANITAVTDATCLCLTRESFEQCFGCLEERMRNGMKRKFLETLPIFANSSFESHEISELVQHVTEQCFRRGDYLCKAGQPYKQDLWILLNGKVVVTHKSGKIFTLGPGDYFGDKSIKGDLEHISSHTAVFEENSTCFVINRKSIEEVIGDIKRLGEYVPFVPSKYNKSIKLKHLKKHRILGMGAFGKVWLASTHKEKKPFALKQLDKQQLIRAKQVKGVIREKDVMFSIEHPFLLSLVSSFQDEFYCYLLMELIQGGELFNVVHANPRKPGIPEHQAKFYSACIVAGLGHLHQRSICYRDLKPENVLIDNQGFCVLVDMGFAKVVVGKTYTLCGTPEYLAPEIIMSKGHDKAVDYWALGVLIYELLAGRSPFYIHGTDQISLFKRIVMVKYQMPKSIPPDAANLIKRLIVRRQSTRLGNLAHGHLDIINQPWFKDLNFKKLLKKQISPPWIPNIKDPFDASHFDDYKHAENDSPPRGTLEKEHQALFKNF